MEEFKKEISSLLKKFESRKGHDVKVLGGKKSIPLVSGLEREIRKLKCSLN